MGNLTNFGVLYDKKIYKFIQKASKKILFNDLESNHRELSLNKSFYRIVQLKNNLTAT